MNTNSILSSVNITNQTYNSFFKTSTIDKVKSDDFENLMASQKSSTQSNTKTTNENKTEMKLKTWTARISPKTAHRFRKK